MNSSAAIFVEGQYIYAATSGQNSTFYIIDGSNLNNISINSSVLIGNSGILKIITEGTNAYLTGKDHGKNLGILKIIDISDKQNPTLLSNFDTQGVSTMGIVIYESKVFLGDTQGGLLVLDISNLSVPTSIGFFDDYRNYCGNVASYAQYIAFRDDPIYGAVIFIAAMGCGMRCIAVNQLDFERNGFNIPGYNSNLIIFVVTIPIFYLYCKIKNQKI